MTLWFPLLLPLLGAFLVLGFKNPRAAVRVALGVGIAEVLLLGNCAWKLRAAGVLQQGRYLRADGLTLFFLINLGLIFAVVLAYSVGYLRHIPKGRFSSPRWFYALVFLFLFTMVAAYLSANLGMLWIAIEATTLASALLVGFYNTKGAVEAGWKYLIVCTVGIAFALFGTIALYLAAVRGGVPAEMALDWAALMAAAPGMTAARDLLKLAFVFVAVGYGTKIGFVPMHSWLPDAHAEAPAPISAMLSAVLLNCAMYALLRLEAITSHAIGSGFSHTLLLAFGCLSLVACRLPDDRATRPEAPAGLQQHRAHGNRRPGRWAWRPARPLWRAAACLQSLAGQNAVVLHHRQRPRHLRNSAHGPHSRHGTRASLHQRRPGRGRARRRRLAALRSVCQRIRHSHVRLYPVPLPAGRCSCWWHFPSPSARCSTTASGC